MRCVLLFLLLTPSALLAAPVDCKKVAEIVKHYELKLMSQGLKEDKTNVCTTKNTAPSGKAPTTAKLLEKHSKLSASQKDALEEFGCSNLATLEARIANLENEQSLLTGFKKMQADLLANKKGAGSKDPKFAKRAGLNFVNGLNAAKNLEAILETGDLIKALKGVPATERATVDKFKAQVAKLCDKNTNAACDKTSFDPNEEAIAAINELLDNSDVSDATISNWKNSLKIKKEDDSAYSFTKMSQELHSSVGALEAGKLKFTNAELKSIAALPDFKDASGVGFSSMKEDMKPVIVLQKYESYVRGLQKRQELELQGKVTVMWHEIKSEKFISSLSPDIVNLCQNAKNDISYSMSCVEAIDKAQAEARKNGQGNTDKTARFEDFKKAFDVSKNYLRSIGNQYASCFEVPINETIKTSGELPRPCKSAIGDIDPRLSVIDSDLQALYLLREEIADKNKDLITLRNYALDQFANHKCGTVFQDEIDCPAEKLKVSDPAEVLASDVSQIMVVRTKSPDKVATSEAVKVLCAQGNFSFKSDLCALGDKFPTPTVKNSPTKINREADKFDAPVTAPDGGFDPADEAIKQGVAQMSKEIFGQWWNGKMAQMYAPPYNPYLYNYHSSMPNTSMWNLSDQVLFNARHYGGYGYYFSSGLPPYTSYPTGTLGTYAPFSGTRSAYFSGR